MVGGREPSRLAEGAGAWAPAMEPVGPDVGAAPAPSPAQGSALQRTRCCWEPSAGGPEAGAWGGLEGGRGWALTGCNRCWEHLEGGREAP